MLPLLEDHKDPSAMEQQEDAATVTPIATKEKPKRPLSSYNYFFQQQRKKILEQREIRPEGKPRRSHGKIGFAELARTISARWKTIDPETRLYFDELAARDKKRYTKEMEKWKKEQDALLVGQQITSSTTGQTTMSPPTPSACNTSELFDLAALSTHCFYQIANTTTPPNMFVPLFPSMGMATGSSLLNLQQQQQQGDPSSSLQITMVQGMTGSCGGGGNNSRNNQLSMSGPRVAELASELGDESVDLLCDLFR